MKSVLAKTFLKLRITQLKRTKKGRERRRLNPFNPLSWIVFVIFFIGYFIGYGVVGLMEMDKNPFKWH